MEDVVALGMGWSVTWLAAGGVSQDAARFGHAGGPELGDTPSKRVFGQGVQVVEVGDTSCGHSVEVWCQFQLGDQAADDARDGSDHNRTDPISDWVPSENQYRAITTRSSGEPDLTPLHQPNPTNPLPDPSLLSR